MHETSQVFIVQCHSCGQRNRIKETEAGGFYRCARCRTKLDAPFRYVVFDSETTGLPSSRSNPYLVQLAWSVHDIEGNVLSERNYTIRPDGFSITIAATRVHGITDKMARRNGVPLEHVVESFLLDADVNGSRLIAHNINFDTKVIGAEIDRLGVFSRLDQRPQYCTMKSCVDLCKIPRRGGGYKWPSLQELHLHLFGIRFQGGHDAMKDVQATARCFVELRRRGHVKYG